MFWKNGRIKGSNCMSLSDQKTFSEWFSHPQLKETWLQSVSSEFLPECNPDLSSFQLIDSHLNLMTFDGKTAFKNFTKLPSLVNEPPANILYLTRLSGGEERMHVWIMMTKIFDRCATGQTDGHNMRHCFKGRLHAKQGCHSVESAGKQQTNWDSGRTRGSNILISNKSEGSPRTVIQPCHHDYEQRGAEPCFGFSLVIQWFEAISSNSQTGRNVLRAPDCRTLLDRVNCSMTRIKTNRLLLQSLYLKWSRPFRDASVWQWL